jgi:predicted HTH transcriptional regulator
MSRPIEARGALNLVAPRCKLKRPFIPLPPDWSLARLMTKHPSQPANPDIARALFLADKIESWGRGIDLIRNACLDYGILAPLFDCDSGGFGARLRSSRRLTPKELR